GLASDDVGQVVPEHPFLGRRLQVELHDVAAEEQRVGGEAFRDVRGGVQAPGEKARFGGDVRLDVGVALGVVGLVRHVGPRCEGEQRHYLPRKWSMRQRAVYSSGVRFVRLSPTIAFAALTMACGLTVSVKGWPSWFSRYPAPARMRYWSP